MLNSLSVSFSSIQWCFWGTWCPVRGLRWIQRILSSLSWFRPSSGPEIWRFSDLAGYYRRFVEGFSSIATPLTRLTQKGAPFSCFDECEVSSQKLNITLTTAPVLVLPTGLGFYTVHCDVSPIGLETALMQDGRVIAYASRQLNIYEKKYYVHIVSSHCSCIDD